MFHVCGHSFSIQLDCALSKSCLLFGSSIYVSGTNRYHIFETQEISKERMDLCPTKLSKCSSYVDYNLAQIIAVDSSLP